MFGTSVSSTRAARMRQEVLDVNRKGEWDETLRRLKSLGLGGGGGGYGFEPGQEFLSARGAYGRAMQPVGDISGEGDLNAAELSALIEGREGISGQQGAAIEELRNTVGRMGGGGSEFQEMAGDIQTGGISARVQLLRDVLSRAQGTREQAKGRSLTAAGGMAGLAGMRESGKQFGAQYGLSVMQQRMNALSGLMGEGYGGGGYAAPSTSQGQGVGDWQTFGQGWSPMTQATELRNAYIPPTQYGSGSGVGARNYMNPRWR